MKIFRRTAFLAGVFFALTAAAADIEEPAFTQAELDQMLAPIALYPDSLLSHILIASTYPLEVVEAARWSRSNPDLEAEDAVDAVEDRAWDPSVKALVAFPQILARMDEDLTWTRRLGDAFLVQEEQVIDTIQNLRAKAYEAGNLRTTEHVRVHREREIIVVEPVRSRVVYVPYYSTRVVYGHWWWPAYPPVYWAPPPIYHRTYRSAGIVWTPYYVPTVFYYSTFDWPHRIIVVNVHHHHRPSYYRPVTRSVRYSSLSTGHSGFSRWHHDPKHRRGVTYRSASLNERYGRTSASGAVQTTTTEARRNWEANHAPRYRRDSDFRRGSDFRRDSDFRRGSSEDRSRFSDFRDRDETDRRRGQATGGRTADRSVTSSERETPSWSDRNGRDRENRERTRPVDTPRTERPARTVEIPRTDRSERRDRFSSENRDGQWTRSRPGMTPAPARSTDRFRSTTPAPQPETASPSPGISRDRRASISPDINRGWAGQQQRQQPVTRRPQQSSALGQEQPATRPQQRQPEARQSNSGGNNRETTFERPRSSLAPAERRAPREREQRDRAPRQRSMGRGR